MEVKFREFNPFDLWIWLEFDHVLSPMEKQYIEELFDSWFYLGKLGGFNAENLQIQETGIDISYMNYNEEYADNAMMSLMHNMSDIESLGNWCRCWCDIGTSDLVCLDILINSFKQLSKEYINVKQLIIGGENDDWPTDKRNDDKFTDD